MEKALQRLAEAKMTSKTVSPKKNNINNSTQTEGCMREINITVVDTPPATPTTQNNHVTSALKGIPKALLEKVNIFIFIFFIILFKRNKINFVVY